MLKSDKNYSNVIQQTEAEIVISEMAEETFKDHLANIEQNQAEVDLGDDIRIGKTSTKDKVGPIGHLFVSKKIFKISWMKNCTKLARYLQVSTYGALFKNEKKLGALASKSKL